MDSSTDGDSEFGDAHCREFGMRMLGKGWILGYAEHHATVALLNLSLLGWSNKNSRVLLG